MINPYASIDFGDNGHHRLLSVSHQHLDSGQTSFDKIYETGVRHFAISKYHPSILSYPYHYNPSYYFKYANNSPTSTDDIETIRDQALTISFANKDDVVGSPNAEHVYTYMWVPGYQRDKWNGVHINGLGSFFESELTPEPVGGYDSAPAGYSYSGVLEGILKNLQYEDGGGVIVNHPYWTNNNRHGRDYSVERFVRDCLDYDPRVLGTDIIESGGNGMQQASGDYTNGYAYNSELIDNILCTGRRCWIFAMPDHRTNRGRNELLLPSNFTSLSKTNQEHECLKAYREGRFFGRLANSDLSIQNVKLTEDPGNSRYKYSITVSNADTIEIISDGIKTTYNGNRSGDTTIEAYVPADRKYVRAVAILEKDSDPNWDYETFDLYKDYIYTNPIMINPMEYSYAPAYDKPKGLNILMWG